jgi:hypothetical protein
MTKETDQNPTLIDEATGSTSKIDTLVRAGLGTVSQMARYRSAISDPRSAIKSIQLREFVSEASEKLFSIVLNDSQTFNRVKSILSSQNSSGRLSEAAFEALDEKASESGIPFATLLEVYNRGLEGHDAAAVPHLTAEQAAFNRVNGFLAGSKSILDQDQDLLEKDEDPEDDTDAPVATPEQTVTETAPVSRKYVRPMIKTKPLSERLSRIQSAVEAKKTKIQEKAAPVRLSKAALDEDDSSGDRHLIMQLKKNITLRGSKPIEFGNGEKTLIDPRQAHQALRMYESFDKPAEKLAYVAKIGKSPQSFMEALQD